MNEDELDNMLEEVSARYYEEYDCYMCQIELEGEVFWYNPGYPYELFEEDLTVFKGD